MIHQKGGYLLSAGHYEELTELQWRAIPHMVVLVAALENGTYETEYLKGNNSENAEMTVEELTLLMTEHKTLPKTKEEVSRKYKLEEVSEADKERWERIKKQYNAAN